MNRGKRKILTGAIILVTFIMTGGMKKFIVNNESKRCE